MSPKTGRDPRMESIMNASNMRKACGVAALITVTLFSMKARASERFEFYKGVRQLGMGGAYTAVVNDETSLLTNPAGLGKLRDTTLTVFDPEISGSFNDTRIATLSEASHVTSLQGLLDAMNSNRGVHWNAKLQLFPSFVTSNFGLGVLAKYEYNAEVDSTGTTFRLDYTNDFAVPLGYCFRLFGGVLKFGVDGRLTDRTEIHQDLAATSTNLSVDGLAKEGLGLASDLGLIITIPVQYLPSISLVARDVGNTAYTMGSGMFHSTSQRPDATPMTVDAGLALFPIFADQTRFTMTVDYHDLGMTGDPDTDLIRRVHAGFELNFHDFFFLRGGLNQRYWTAGVELATENFQLQAATYGEDVGPIGSPKEDRRFVTKAAFRF